MTEPETFTEWRIAGASDGEEWEHGCPFTDEASVRASAERIIRFNDRVVIERRTFTASPWELVDELKEGKQ